MKEVKLLTIINKLNLGGIEKTFLSSITPLHSEGYKCSILCNKGGTLEEDFKNKGVNIHYFGNFKFPVTNAILLFFLILRYKYQLVHVRDGFTSGFFILACKLINVPVIVSIHNSDPQFKTSWKDHYFYNKIRNLYLYLHKFLIYKFSSKIIGHSQNNLSYYKKSFKDHSKFHILYNGVDFKSMSNNTSDGNSYVKRNFIQLIHVGSFKKQKNHTSLILIFNDLIKKGYNIKLILCGEGREKDKIKNLVNSLGLTSLIDFKGNVGQPSLYLTQSDIFVFPSLHEGFGNVLIEAQYNRVAICCSDIPPHYESVSQKYYKFFFTPEDISKGSENIEEIIKLIQNGRIESYLDEGKIFAEKFSIENMVRNLNTIYKDVL